MSARAPAELPPSSWAANPGYVIHFDSLPARVRVELGGETVGESGDACVMYELGHAPVYYLPQADVRSEVLEPTEHRTHCPYKGDACYWSVRIGDRVVENGIWSYPAPYREMACLAGWLGFYWDRFDAWYEDAERVDAPREISGRCNQHTHFAACYPSLAREWHPERNPRLKPYEFPAESGTVVWWRDARGREWRDSIRARVLREAGRGG